MIELLGLGKKHGYAPLQAAVDTALASGCGDVATVRYAAYRTGEPVLRRNPGSGMTGSL